MTGGAASGYPGELSSHLGWRTWTSQSAVSAGLTVSGLAPSTQYDFEVLAATRLAPVRLRPSSQAARLRCRRRCLSGHRPCGVRTRSELRFAGMDRACDRRCGRQLYRAVPHHRRWIVDNGGDGRGGGHIFGHWPDRGDRRRSPGAGGGRGWGRHRVCHGERRPPRRRRRPADRPRRGCRTRTTMPRPGRHQRPAGRSRPIRCDGPRQVRAPGRWCPASSASSTTIAGLSLSTSYDFEVSAVNVADRAPGKSRW